MTPATVTFGSWQAAHRERLATEADAHPRLSVLHLVLGPEWTAARAARQGERAPERGDEGTTA